MTRINSHNGKAIIEAQKAFVSCTCSICMSDRPRPGEQCDAERKLWAELERGEDMYIAAVGAK